LSVLSAFTVIFSPVVGTTIFSEVELLVAI
jgi:hypothetical protein